MMAPKKDGHNATGLLRAAKKRAGKIPSEFVTDALPSYSKAHAKVYAAKNSNDKLSIHHKDASLGNKKHNNNNIQERFNGTARKFLKPRRGIKNNTQTISGFMVLYNLLKTHSYLKKTPAEAAGITIKDDYDRWGHPDRKCLLVCQDDWR